MQVQHSTAEEAGDEISDQSARSTLSIYTEILPRYLGDLGSQTAHKFSSKH